MNIKTYKNILFDSIIILFDIMLALVMLVLPVRLWGACNMAGKGVCFVLVYTVILLIMFSVYELYTKTIRRKLELIVSVVLSNLISTVGAFIIGFIFDFQFMTKNFLLLLGAIISLTVASIVWKLILVKLITKYGKSPALLVIESAAAESRLARKLKYTYAEISNADVTRTWYLMIDTENKEEIDDLVENKIKEFDSVYISSQITDKVKNRIISKAISEEKEIYVLPTLYNLSMTKYSVVHFDDTPLLRLKYFKISRFERVIKRTIDILTASVAVIVLSPVMLFCAIAVKLDSKGPIIYKQERLTLNEKTYNIFKFRTMYADAEKKTGAVLSTNDDPRITRIGKILRKSRLDELPQMFNVLGGSMSIVGPRPERPFFVKQFKKEVANYDKRFSVKAGLTGYAQVYGKYDTDVYDKTLYDLMYIRDFSLWLDIKLILLTVKVMFLKESAAGVKEIPEYEKNIKNREKTSADA